MFYAPVREFYNLEGMWGDAKMKEVAE
ncbi:MAG: hypothetical protein ABEH43_05355 [Flavobacteriales bacterium]